MKVDLDKAQKPLRKLRKLIRDFSANPTAGEVHTLRTQARRLEASVHALTPEPGKDARRLLKMVKALRKAAGEVRDLDVLRNALTIVTSGEDSSGEDAEASLTRLIDHMGALRKRNAEHLYRVLARRRKKVVELLKHYSEQIEEAAPRSESPDLDAARRLAAELEHWPRLHADNLHGFRIHAKKLGYILQLTPEVDVSRMDAFARVKDTAGEWHDWMELSKLAATVLDHAVDGAVLDRIESVMREKLRAALACANSLRRLGLGIDESSAAAAASQNGAAKPARKKAMARTKATNGATPRKPPVSETSFGAATPRRARG
jgi:CHAD domain-containing protein